MNASRRGAAATKAPSGRSSPGGGASARGNTTGADSPKRGPTGGASSTPGSPKRAQDRRFTTQSDGGGGSQPLSRVNSFVESKQEEMSPDPEERRLEDSLGLFHVIEQLAALEGALWSILDGLKSNATHVSYFCREYWGTSASHAQLSLEKLVCNERLKRQVQQACVLESLSLAVASNLCSGVMQGVSVTVRSRLRNLLYYIHENCLVLLDLICQRWLAENPVTQLNKWGHCPENLNLDILVRVKRYRRLRKGEHIMALRQHNEMIANVVRQLCRGAASKRAPLSSRSVGSGDRSPARGPGANTAQQQAAVLSAVNDILSARMPLDRLRANVIRQKMLQFMRFKPLLKVDGSDPDCPWPATDPYDRYGADRFAQDGPIIWFEPLPPMLPNLEQNPKLPPAADPDVYTLVLDLDETLVHYFEFDGMGNYDIRPGMADFLQRMSALGYEIVIFTAATQDYADWVIDQIDPDHLIHYRLYRQHALPWGPIFVKDMSRLGRDLDRLLIIDNVQENFMLQPHNGIFICTWYDDPHDTALSGLTPLLEELITTRVKVPEILDKYLDQIPAWAGFSEQYEEFDPAGLLDEGDLPPPPLPSRAGAGRGAVAAPAFSSVSGPYQSAPATGAVAAPAFSSVSGPYQSAPASNQLVMQPLDGVMSAGGFRSDGSASAAFRESVRQQEASPPSSPPIGGMGLVAQPYQSPNGVRSRTNSWEPAPLIQQQTLNMGTTVVVGAGPAVSSSPTGSYASPTGSYIGQPQAHVPQRSYQGGYAQMPQAVTLQQAARPAVQAQVRQAQPLPAQTQPLMGPQRAMAPTIQGISSAGGAPSSLMAASQVAAQPQRLAAQATRPLAMGQGLVAPAAQQQVVASQMQMRPAASAYVGSQVAASQMQSSPYQSAPQVAQAPRQAATAASPYQSAPAAMYSPYQAGRPGMVPQQVQGLQTMQTMQRR